MNAIHKDNAKYTFIAYLYPKGLLGVNHPVIGNNGGAAGVGVGFHFGLQNNDKAFMRCANGVGSGALLATSTNGTNDSAWNFIGASVDEATAFGAFQVNAAQETFVSTYTTPSAANASQVTEIGARGNGSAPLPNGVRLACLAVWEGVTLSQAQMNSIFQATRGIYGI